MTFASGDPVKLIGGRLALDFLNTADWTAAGEAHQEMIESMADIAAWVEAAGVADARLPEDASSFRALRARLRPAFVGVSGEAAGKAAGEAAACAAINALLKGIAGDALAPRTGAPPTLAELVAIDAASLLVDRRATVRLKRCPGPDCGWLFIDETKNGRRRWCMMETCGNRAKARRHYARTRGA